MLHIVNGDTVADKLRQGIVQGDILVWKEIYTEGPIFEESSDRDNRLTRGQYLEQTMGIPYAEYVHGCEYQESVLSRFHTYKEIVLWFEHDLFDQTMLCFLLHWFAGRSLDTTKLSLLCIGTFPGVALFRGLGQLSVQQLSSLVGTWQPVGQDELSLGKRLWQAYCSSDPDMLIGMLDHDQMSALPYAKEAFRLHGSRYPSVLNGLGIVEQTTLEMVHAGTVRPHDLFKCVGDALHGLGMGDLSFWRILARLTRGPHPLLDIEGNPNFPTYTDPVPLFGHGKLSLTGLGKEVMDGRQDWVELAGIDEWYGGVHLDPQTDLWRWNPSQQRLMSTE